MYRMFRQPTAAAVCIIAIASMTPPTFAQDEQEKQPLEEWERRELKPLVDAVGAALQGDLVQTVNPFDFGPDFLKGAEGNTYVPFTLTVDPSKIGESTVLMYLVVIPHVSGEQAEPEDTSRAYTPGAAEELIDARRRELFGATTESSEDLFASAAFEDAFFIDVAEGRSADGPVEIHRAFHAPGGSYDVYIALRDSKGEDADEDDLAESAVMMLKQEVMVPDLWSGELQTSSIIIARVVEPLAAPLTPEEQLENPYTIGGTRIVPKRDTDFGKDEELSVIMLIYNPQLAGEQKPDLTVDYTFHKSAEEGEEFFNRTTPQEFNAQTLPPAFDIAAGHQIVAGQSVPLASFPAGSYRLEIKVSDNASGQTLQRDVNFIVNE